MIVYKVMHVTNDYNNWLFLDKDTAEELCEMKRREDEFGLVFYKVVALDVDES